MIRLRPILHVLAPALGVSAFLAGCHYLGVAHAAATADPVATATAATSSSWDLVTHQGPLLGALLLASGLYRQFLRANESSHWIAQGKTLAILTGLGMVIGATLDWKLNGGPAAGIITALFAAIPLVMHSTVKAAPAAAIDPVSPPGSGTTLLGLLVLGALAMQPGCATVKATPGAAKVAAIECAKQDAAPILSALAQFGAQAALSALTGGAIDWSGLEASALIQGKVVGGCALTRFVAELAKAPKSETAARALVAGPDPAADGQAAIARLSGRFGGATWSVQ